MVSASFSYRAHALITSKTYTQGLCPLRVLQNQNVPVVNLAIPQTVYRSAQCEVKTTGAQECALCPHAHTAIATRWWPRPAVSLTPGGYLLFLTGGGSTPEGKYWDSSRLSGERNMYNHTQREIGTITDREK